MLRIANAIWLPIWAVLGPVAFGFSIYLFYGDAPVSLTPVAAQQSEVPVVPSIDKATGALLRPKAMEIRFEIQNLSRHPIRNALLDCSNDITRIDVSLDDPRFSLIIPESFSLAAGSSRRESCYVRVSLSPTIAFFGYDTALSSHIIKKTVKLGDKRSLYVVSVEQ